MHTWWLKQWSLHFLKLHLALCMEWKLLRDKAREAGKLHESGLVIHVSAELSAPFNRRQISRRSENYKQARAGGNISEVGVSIPSLSEWRFRLEQGCNCVPSFWLCTPSWARWNKKVLSLWIILYRCVDRNAWESEKFACAVTDDVWWNFHVWKFHKLLGRPNRDGQPRRPQGLWSIASPVLGDLNHYCLLKMCYFQKCLYFK